MDGLDAGAYDGERGETAPGATLGEGVTRWALPLPSCRAAECMHSQYERSIPYGVRMRSIPYRLCMRGTPYGGH